VILLERPEPAPALPRRPRRTRTLFEAIVLCAHRACDERKPDVARHLLACAGQLTADAAIGPQRRRMQQMVSAGAARLAEIEAAQAALR
jgi:hypothetical protein